MPPPEKPSGMVAIANRLIRTGLACWTNISSKKKKITATAVVAGTFILVGGCYGLFAPNAWELTINDQRVALASSRLEIERALEDIIQENETSNLQGVNIADKLEYRKIRASSREITANKDLKQKIQGKIRLIAEATAINIDGQQQLIVKNEETADAILEELKQTYLPPEGTAKIQDVKFAEKVTYSSQRLGIGEIVEPKVALAKLKGTEAIEEYFVKKGDSLWSIARKHDLLVDDILSANPDIKGERLDIDQKLLLTYEKPLLQVVVVYNQEIIEPIPYAVKTENNSDLYRGQEKVKKAGVEGEQKVTYRIVTKNGTQVEKEVLEKQTLKEPVTKIVERGTRMAVASRGGGSGRLAWPVNGLITSRYGYRGREFHSGLDIAAPSGTPIGAAEGGTVTFVGSSGNYGRMIQIDHGGGLTTCYAHLSGYNVKTGQEVKRGQTIGYIGSTGRATGPHLHFEVRVGGSSKDPISYLN